MFTCVMKRRIEELIEEKLNQEFPEEVETGQNEDSDSDEEVTSETEAANMAMNLEAAMKLAEEEDLWIGDSGASIHMMGSEEHMFNKK